VDEWHIHRGFDSVGHEVHRHGAYQHTFRAGALERSADPAIASSTIPGN
jgi:hypothetical protein